MQTLYIYIYIHNYKKVGKKSALYIKLDSKRARELSIMNAGEKFIVSFVKYSIETYQSMSISTVILTV